MATLAERIAAARTAAADVIAPEDQAEIEQRAELAQAEAALRELERKKRDLDLARRVDSAMAKLGDKVRVRGVSIVGCPDTFIVRSNPIAHRQMVEDLSRINVSAAQGQVVEREPVRIRYALACMYDWNGEIQDGTNAELTAKLSKFLRDEYPGALTPITDAASELAGIIAEERKS
jgi:hypothetical protein